MCQAGTPLRNRKRGAVDAMIEQASLNVAVLGAEALPERGIPGGLHPRGWLIIFRLICVDPATRHMT